MKEIVMPISLCMALKLTDMFDTDEVIFLKKADAKPSEGVEIVSVQDAKRKYAIHAVKVIKIEPKFLSGDYAGFLFTITM